MSAWAKDRSAAPAVNAPGEDSPPSGNRDGGIFCTDVNSGAERQPAFSGHAGEAAKSSGVSLGFGVSHLAGTRALLPTSGTAQGRGLLTSVSLSVNWG